MTAQLTARASSDHVNSVCAGAVKLANEGRGISRDEEGDPKDIGHQAHAVFARMVNGEEIDANELPEPVRILYFCARKIWEDIKEFFAGKLETECRLDVDQLTGATDVICYNAQFNWLLVLDWKTGRVERNHRPQLLGYAGRWVVINAKWPAKIFMYSADVRAMSYTVEEATTQEAMSHIGKISGNLYLAETHESSDLQIYNRGSHCEFCPCSERCPAVRADLSRFYEIATSQPVMDLASMDDTQIAEAYNCKKLMQRFMDTFDDALRLEVAARGNIALGDGRELVFTTSTNRHFNPRKTAEHLREIASVEEILECFKASTTDVRDLIKSKAPARKKAAFEKEWLEKLERWGACVLTESNKLTARKCGEVPTQIAEDVKP